MTEEEVINFAAIAHAGQKRKYTLEPYVEHPIRVAETVKTVSHTREMIFAAYLHDVVEDTPISLEVIKNKFGEEVAGLVQELTDEFVTEEYPNLNRKQRKVREVKRQARMSDQAKTIKLADVIDNTRDIVRNDRNFARKYIPEMYALTGVLQGGDLLLLEKARKEVEKGIKILNLKIEAEI